jgi:hypothetical protein
MRVTLPPSILDLTPEGGPAKRVRFKNESGSILIYPEGRLWVCHGTAVVNPGLEIASTVHRAKNAHVALFRVGGSFIVKLREQFLRDGEVPEAQELGKFSALYAGVSASVVRWPEIDVDVPVPVDGNYEEVVVVVESEV